MIWYAFGKKFVMSGLEVGEENGREGHFVGGFFRVECC